MGGGRLAMLHVAFQLCKLVQSYAHAEGRGLKGRKLQCARLVSELAHH